MRNTDNPVTRLAAAVARVGAHEWPVRLTPVDGGAARDASPTWPAPRRRRTTPTTSSRSSAAAARMLSAVIRNSANPTGLDAGYKVNVVPGEAQAQVDGRFLPGYEDEFFATLAELLGDGHRRRLHLATRRPSRRRTRATSSARWSTALLAEDPDALVVAVPHARRHRRQALGQARHRLLRLRAAAAARPTSTSPRSSTASTSGCPVDALEFGARVFDRFLDLV